MNLNEGSGNVELPVSAYCTQRNTNIACALMLLPALVFNAGLIDLNPQDSDDFLLGGKKSRCGRRIGEIEHVE